MCLHETDVQTQKAKHSQTTTGAGPLGIVPTPVVAPDAHQKRLSDIRAAWNAYQQKQPPHWEPPSPQQQREPPSSPPWEPPSPASAVKQDDPQGNESVKRILAEIGEWNCFREGRTPRKKAIKQVLKLFWDEWQRQRTSAEKLALLASVANGLRARVDKRRLTQMRAMHDGQKHQFVMQKDCATNCGRRAEVRHHIIPLTHGGGNGRQNLIAICKTCHAVIHPWLARVVREPDDALPTAA